MTTLRSSFESCMTERLRVSPGFKVWACATPVAVNRQSKKMNVRILLLQTSAAIDGNRRTEPRFTKKIESASEAINRNASPYKRLATGEGALHRENTVLLLVCNDVPDELGRYGLFAPGEAVNQGRIA